MRRERNVTFACAFVCVLVLAGLPADEVRADGPPRGPASQTRLVREAVALFQQIQRSPELAHRCAIEANWHWYGAEPERLRHHLGPRARHRTGPPPVSPQQIMDPGRARPDLYCDADTQRRAHQEINAAFWSDNPSATSHRLQTIGYSFPVFNANYTRAVVMEHLTGLYYRRPSDSGTRSGLEYDGGAAIYEKRGGVWRRLRFELYYSGHG